MSCVRIEFEVPNRIYVIGEINHDNVLALVAEGQSVMQQHNYFHIDLRGISHANSAGVALLTEWLRFARANNKQISFHSVPEHMLAMIELCGLAKLLPIEA